ncbi:Predicted O-methyltransferase YrrM [Rhodoblastus acidophilus]|uniref:Predicted O-methyltransferase YrrM n=1 Tax=Rhodoblastus acidophilus TaxID=1074 RepID=A0A212QNK1_RHOAC|nr:O-methyltransferase [Rhodoblastus acidophilus]PPQ38946.1 O-methyltransferase [Rhodoblastus acidophilus]RAI20117.1 O-methyltransferase [Rhodoblastus acidophilus]SNB60965.1 Predicted O-methyltransferase YrrM [Rhodoblastus acidophilus]
MTEADWGAVDAYIGERLLAPDPALDAALAANRAAGLPSIDVSPPQGKFLHVLARATGAKTILEIGTLGGYSTIWLARALPEDGQVVTLEYAPAHADVARSNLAAAGLAGKVDLRVGAALDLLPALAAEGRSFDFVFIDADKENNAAYLDWALKLARVGATVIVDNVVRKGAILDATNLRPDVEGTRRFFDYAAEEKRWTATALQTVGAKGWDGFAIGVVEERAFP